MRPEGPRYDGMTKEEWRRNLLERRAAAKASVRLHKPKVTAVKVPEDYIHVRPTVTVEFTLPDGQRVVGDFSLSCWGTPPRELIPTAEKHRELAQKRVPMVTVGRPNRAPREQ